MRQYLGAHYLHDSLLVARLNLFIGFRYGKDFFANAPDQRIWGLLRGGLAGPSGDSQGE
jgi:hypothetical protein